MATRTRGAKASRQARARQALRGTGALTADEMFDDLCDQYRAATGAERTRIGIELLPYMKPKLKSVDLNVAGEMSIKIKIGGKPQ